MIITFSYLAHILYFRNTCFLPNNMLYHHLVTSRNHSRSRSLYREAEECKDLKKVLYTTRVALQSIALWDGSHTGDNLQLCEQTTHCMFHSDALFISTKTVLFKERINIFIHIIISPLPVWTPEGTIGLPSVRPSVSPSVCPLKNGSFDNLKTINVRRMKLGMCIGSNMYNMHAQHLSRYLKGQCHIVRPIPLLFEVGLKTNFTEMIAILRRHVARNIWVATLKVKVTAWPCIKIVSGQ